VADLTAYIVLRKWDPTQLAEVAAQVGAPGEVWEPIGSAEAATREAAIEAVLDGKEVDEGLELRAVPSRFWGEVYGAQVKVETTVNVAPMNPAADAKAKDEPEPEPAEDR
jgi:hypothetical protein